MFKALNHAFKKLDVSSVGMVALSTFLESADPKGILNVELRE